MRIKQIQSKLNKNGFELNLKKRANNQVNDIALYSLSKRQHVYAYEIHIIRTRPVTASAIRFCPKLQGYDLFEINPSNEDFGIYGFAYDKLEDVYVDYPELRGNSNE